MKKSKKLTLEKKVDRILEILEIAQDNENWCKHEWEPYWENTTTTYMPVRYCRKCGRMALNMDNHIKLV